jgi:hypothetical protein
MTFQSEDCYCSCKLCVMEGLLNSGSGFEVMLCSIRKASNNCRMDVRC